MEQTDTDEMGAGGKASLIALAGTITFVIGVLLAAILGPIGLFFLVLGGVTVLASPVIWLLILWDNRSDDYEQPPSDGCSVWLSQSPQKNYPPMLLLSARTGGSKISCHPCGYRFAFLWHTPCHGDVRAARDSDEGERP